jgi:hypothetical protein
MPISKDAQLNEILYASFLVTDSDGDAVTGLVTGDFTKKLYNPSNVESSGTITVTVTELGNGMYKASFTPNAEGTWTLLITHATYLPLGVQGDFEIHEDRVLIKRILGLVQENMYIDTTTFSSTNMLTARLRIYSAAGSVGTANNVIGTYTITATYNTDNTLKTYQIVKA